MATRGARGQAAARDCPQEQRRPWRLADGCGGKARAITIRSGGEPSSLRAELGSIDKALELAPVDKDLCVLTDSLSAIHLLCRWLRRSLFTPYVSSVRCPDIVQSVLGNLGRRSRGTANTTLMKVRAHSTCELNGAAGRLAGDHRRLQEAE